jgi:hypothetical protein
MMNNIVIESQEILELAFPPRHSNLKMSFLLMISGNILKFKKPTDRKRQSIILWAKDNKFDTTPTETNRELPHLFW